MASLTNYQLPGQLVPYQSDLTLAELPRFAAIPKEQLNCIASPSGLTWLPKSKFKSAYMGSKVHAVDCHGIPWRKRKNLKVVMSGEVAGKKEAPVETGADKSKNILNPISILQISNYLSTLHNPNGSSSPKLSTGPREYKIKKSLVRNRILAYTASKKGCKHLYFFTVTFPAGMPEPMGYRCLNTWFTSLRKQNLIREYLWIAERQPETGTIHFHIAVPHYMKVQHVNGIMRKILLRYAVLKEIPFSPAYFAPGKYNGVDIQGTWASGKKYVGPKTATNFADKRKSKSLTFYLTKYVTKNNETFEHLAWHNSRGFSAVFFSAALSESQVRASGLSYYLVPSHSEKIFIKYGEFGPMGEDGTGKYPDVEMYFRPWRRDAPQKFWDIVNEVNNFFQSIDELEEHFKTHKPEITMQNFDKPKYQKPVLDEGTNRLSFDDAKEHVLTNERRMQQAFIRFCGDFDYSKEFSDEMYFKILQRIDFIGMQREFIPLRALLCSVSEIEFSYLYHLYCYWAIDLLNQIPE